MAVRKLKSPPSPFPSFFDPSALQAALVDMDEDQVIALRFMFGFVLQAAHEACYWLRELDDFVEDGETYHAATPQRRDLALQTLRLAQQYSGMLGATDLDVAIRNLRRVFADAEPGLPDRALAKTATIRAWEEEARIGGEIESIERRERRYRNAQRANTPTLRLL